MLPTINHKQLEGKKKKAYKTYTSPTSTASSVRVATVKTTPKRPSIAKVIAWASLATKTDALDASLSKLHSIPAKDTNCHSYHRKVEWMMTAKVKSSQIQRFGFKIIPNTTKFLFNSSKSLRLTILLMHHI